MKLFFDEFPRNSLCNCHRAVKTFDFLVPHIGFQKKISLFKNLNFADPFIRYIITSSALLSRRIFLNSTLADKKNNALSKIGVTRYATGTVPLELEIFQI